MNNKILILLIIAAAFLFFTKKDEDESSSESSGEGAKSPAPKKSTPRKTVSAITLSRGGNYESMSRWEERNRHPLRDSGMETYIQPDSV